MIRVGTGTYGAEQIRCLTYGVQGSELHIGNYCSIAPGVTVLLGGNHRYNHVTTYPFNIKNGFGSGAVSDGYSNGDVRIGHDVWIGQDVTIMSGVTIGNGAVIAACSVIVKDVEPYAIVGGNPAKFIKLRFTPKQIDQLNNIAWWHWPLDKIEQYAMLLLQDDIDLFIDEAQT